MINTNIINFPSTESRPTRDGYGEGLVELGKTNPDVVVLCGDLSESTRSLDFAKQFPDRFIEVGVAEQNMAGIATGMALEGFIPFCSSYAVFNPGRNWDQIRVSVCYTNANVKIVGAHAGVSVGPDGATHQGLEDIAIMRVLPHMTVLVPADAIQTKQATLAAAAWPGPVYIRFAREKTPVFIDKNSPFTIGKAQVLREGTDVTIVGCGPLAYEALKAAEELGKGKLWVMSSESGMGYQGESKKYTSSRLDSQRTTHNSSPLSAEVINVHTIKPLDVETIVKSVKKTGRLVTVEEHQVIGGLGSAVAEALSEFCPVPIIRVGMQDTFGESGEPEELLAKYHMTSDDITQAVHRVINQ